MSITISLKHSMARGTDAALSLFQHILIIAGLFLAFGILNIFAGDSLASDMQPVESQATEVSDLAVPAVHHEVAPSAEALSPSMQGALDYVKSRYHVSPDALIPVFEMAQLTGKERHIDPLLIVAIIAIESRFNPFAESAMGAQGLMQVIPRFHKDKLPKDKGSRLLLDPGINIRVGVHVLEDAIRRSGGLIAGLQSYAGSSDPEGNYSIKVLAEKARLEQAARRFANTNA